METLVYLATAALTVLWSVWIYLWWESRAGLPEESALRLVLIVAPSTYFLLLALSGWSQVPGFRLDLVGLVLLDAVTLLAALLLAILLRLRRTNHRAVYVVILALYNAIALFAIGTVYLIRNDATLLLRVSVLVGQWQHLDLLSFTWLAGGARGSQPDLASLLNKILIALLSYIPVSIIRYIAAVRLRRRLERKLAQLSAKVDRLEERLAGGESGVVKYE